ncbi:MAG: penicillin-binding protein 2 [Bacteroidetes bacterium]|nr:penicillin-binding protein 2 [Bacteroidota bacterium]
MKDRFDNRFRNVVVIVTVLSAILLFRLFYIQLVAQQYKQFAEENTRSRKTVLPARGLIYDRNGKRLVTNETVYDLIAVLKQIEPFDTHKLAEILGLDTSFFSAMCQKLADEKRYYTPTVVLRELGNDVVARFQEQKFNFRGFSVKARIGRRFDAPVAAHLLGYLGEVDESDIASSDGYYELQHFIGKSGLEKQYETVLRGEKGYEYKVVDKFNREIGSYANGQFDIQAKAGTDLVSTIDLELQAYGELLMQNKIGAIVAIEPSTGEVLALVSSPSFDPSLLVGRKRSHNYPVIAADPNKPLYNRAITGAYPPGSTFKPIMALIALQEGTIVPTTTFSCHMGFTIPGLHVGCHDHPNNLDLVQSISQSCNAYYCHSFRNTIDHSKFANTEAGYRAWYDHLTRFGLGGLLHLDIPNESGGVLPTAEKFDNIYGKGRWRSSYIISLAIGQAEINLTPLQMANMMAVVANRGYYYDPHLVRSPMPQGLGLHHTAIDKRHFEPVIEGLAQVFLSGTARWYQLPDIAQCGKTGTAENPHGEDHSNFIAFAPRDNPKIAIAVVVENGGFGATWAAPIASLMIEKYLTGQVARAHAEKRILEKDFIHLPDTLTIPTPHEQ